MGMIINPHRHGGSLYGNDFVLEMATTGAAETVTIPCQNVGSFNATIDWGDATSDSTITTYNDGDLAHEYADAGDHIIRISGTFANIYFNNGGDKAKLKRVLNWGNTGLVTLKSAFWGCANLTSVTSESANTAAVTDMANLFLNCTGLVTCDVSGFNVAEVLAMNSMFQGCTSITTLDTSGWNPVKVTTFSNTFAECTSLATIGDTSGWGTDAALNMQRMFNACGALATFDVSGWNTASVTDMTWMFRNCNNVTDIAIDNWDIEAVTSFVAFMTFGAGLITSRYDAVLIAWDAQNPVDSLSCDFGGSKYTGGGAAATARASLESGDLWTITDGGIA